MARAVDGRKHATAAHGLEPIKVAGDHVSGLVKDRRVVHHLPPFLLRRKDGLLDAKGIGNAVLQVAENFLGPRLLLGQFFCTLLHLAFEFALVLRERTPHLKQGFSKGVVVAQGFVGRVEIATPHFLGEFLGSGQPLRKAVHRHGHVSDFIRGNPHVAVGQDPPTHVKQGALQFLDRLNDASGHNDPQGHAQNQYDPCHPSGVHGQLSAELFHPSRAVTKGRVLACSQRRQPALHAGGKDLQRHPRIGVIRSQESLFCILVPLPIGKQTHDFSVQHKQCIGLCAQGVQMGARGRGPRRIERLQLLEMVRELPVHHATERDLLFVVRPALLLDPIVDVHQGRSQGLVHVFKGFEARNQRGIDLLRQFAALRQRGAGEEKQHGHREDEHPKSEAHAPCDVPTKSLHRFRASSS